MQKPSILFLLLILIYFSVLLRTRPVVATRTEHWGYTTLPRPQGVARLFWWYYSSGLELSDKSSKWPIILWLEGGPGSSGVAFGNFIQIGPTTVENEERPYTWLWEADLLFVDSPVGTGFSYVDRDSLLVKTDKEAADDLLFLLKDVFGENEAFENRPLYIYGEGYGGKIAACLGVQVEKAIKNKELVLRIGGVILADSWISPQDSVLAIGPLLKHFSRLSSNCLAEAESLANTISQLTPVIDPNGVAVTTWNLFKQVINRCSSNVDLHNIMMDAYAPLVGTTIIYGTERIMRTSDSRNYSTHMHVLPNDQAPFNFFNFMNGPIKQKLGTIVIHVKWIQWNQKVFDAMKSDYVKPRTEEVAELLTKGVSVTIINGQYDVECSTKGVEAWVEKLTDWKHLPTFLTTKREIYRLPKSKETAAFITSHKNLAFYSILRAGHYVTFDQPILLRRLVHQIIDSPATEPPTV